MTMVKRLGLVSAPVAGSVCYSLLPLRYSTAAGEWVEFTHAGRATLGVMVWMAVWWLTEALDLEVTALLPIVAFPLLGIAPLHKVLPPYAALDLAADLAHGNWMIRLFARNVTDRRAYIGGGLGINSDNVPYGIDANVLQPRTVGISVDVGF